MIGVKIMKDQRITEVVNVGVTMMDGTGWMNTQRGVRLQGDVHHMVLKKEGFIICKKDRFSHFTVVYVG